MTTAEFQERVMEAARVASVSLREAAEAAQKFGEAMVRFGQATADFLDAISEGEEE